MRWFFLVAVLASCSGVPLHGTARCPAANQARCDVLGGKVEMCGPNGYWIVALDCGAMGEGWYCTPTPEPSCSNLASKAKDK